MVKKPLPEKGSPGMEKHVLLDVSGATPRPFF